MPRRLVTRSQTPGRCSVRAELSLWTQAAVSTALSVSSRMSKVARSDSQAAVVVEVVVVYLHVMVKRYR